MKRAFTLIELLVVIGIIGVLAGVLLASFGGATESARASQCLSNMRALAVAANSYAMQHEWYPLAGSREAIGIDDSTGKQYYESQAGWISWMCKGNYEDSDGNARATAHRSNQNVPFYDSGNVENMTFALTNGTLWISCARNRSLYVCPEHKRYRTAHGQPEPFFSYVMNARFGWDTSKGSKAVGTASSRGAVYYGSLTRADKTLLFAELPTVDVEGKEAEATPAGLKADCVLQYQDVTASGTGKHGANSSSGGDAESIGFVHKVGKRGRCAHVAFADGHTEKLIWRDGGDDPKTLTAYLCRGWDVTFDAKNGWSLAQDADKAD